MLPMRWVIGTSGPSKQMISFAHSPREIFGHPRWSFFAVAMYFYEYTFQLLP